MKPILFLYIKITRMHRSHEPSQDSGSVLLFGVTFRLLFIEHSAYITIFTR